MREECWTEAESLEKPKIRTIHKMTGSQYQTKLRIFCTSHQSKDRQIRAMIMCGIRRLNLQNARIYGNKTAPFMRWHFLLAAVVGTGCVPMRGTAAPDETAMWRKDGVIARVHFAGTGAILADATATNLSAMAALPETAALREQTFRKLAVAPYNFLRDRAATTNDEAALIRPLLDDLFHAESFLELKDGTNEVPEMVFALRLDDDRARLWRTNLAAVLGSRSGLPVTAIQAEGFDGWELRKHHDPNLFRFFRAGNWVVLGWGEDTLHLQPAILQRIRQTKRPVDADSENWLDAWADWPALAPHHLAPQSVELPAMRLKAQGRKEFVRSQLTMKFAAPLGLKLNPWQFPTNIIPDPIASFTATRGMAPLLNKTAKAKEYNLPPLPDQVYVWALKGTPMETHLAAPVADGSNYMRQLEPGLLALLNAFLSGHAPSSIGTGPGTGRALTITAVRMNNEIELTGLPPFVAPRLGVVHDSGHDYLLGGLMPTVKGRQGLAPQFISEITNHGNLIGYGWEFTGDRIKEWHAIFQLEQSLFNPRVFDFDAAARTWIEAVWGRLGNSGTEVSLTAPDEVTVVRNSTIGFTALELSGLAYWLDSPGFPLSTYSESPRWRALAPGQPPPARKPAAPAWKD